MAPDGDRLRAVPDVSKGEDRYCNDAHCQHVFALVAVTAAPYRSWCEADVKNAITVTALAAMHKNVVLLSRNSATLC